MSSTGLSELIKSDHEGQYLEKKCISCSLWIGYNKNLFLSASNQQMFRNLITLCRTEIKCTIFLI